MKDITGKEIKFSIRSYQMERYIYFDDIPVVRLSHIPHSEKWEDAILKMLNSRIEIPQELTETIREINNAHKQSIVWKFRIGDSVIVPQWNEGRQYSNDYYVEYKGHIAAIINDENTIMPLIVVKTAPDGEIKVFKAQDVYKAPEPEDTKDSET